MSNLSRNNSSAGYQSSGKHSHGIAGATSVWVGSHPSSNATNTQQLTSQMAALRFSSEKDSNPRQAGYRHQNSTGSYSSDDVSSPGEGQYFVVSVRDSTSSEGDSGYNDSSTFSPRAPKKAVSPGTTGYQNQIHDQNGSLPSLNSTGSDGQLQYQKTYLQQQQALGVSNVYGSTGFLPTSASLSPDLLAASLGQPSFDTQALLSSMNYLNQPVDVNVLAAALAASQPMLSPLQSPTSPVFMSPTFTPQLPVLPLSSSSLTSLPTLPLTSSTLASALPTGAPLLPPSLTSPLPLSSPMFTPGPVPLAQSSLYLNSINSQTPLLNGQPSLSPVFHNSTPLNNHTAAGDVVTRKRSNLSNTGSFDDQTTSGVGSSVPSTPSDSSPTSPRYEPHHDHHPLAGQDASHVQFAVPPCYDRPADKDACLRCEKKVYAMEKLGPVKDVLYHKTCFTCAACHTTLTLQNFHHSDADMADLHVYCHSHKPVAKPNPVDANAVGIQRALSVPKLGRVNDQIRGGPEAGKHVHMDSHSVSIRSAMSVPAPSLQTSIKTREGAWFREQRQSERMPPQDVVKHDGKAQRYEGSKSLYINTAGT